MTIVRYRRDQAFIHSFNLNLVLLTAETIYTISHICMIIQLYFDLIQLFMIRMRLDFFDLQLFINIVDTGSLTKGAERSSISLQAASERIKKLEQQYATSLLPAMPLGSNSQLQVKLLQNRLYV